MRTVPLNETQSVTLNGSGAGTVKIGPVGHAVTWSPAVASVSCVPSPPTNEAQCKIFVGEDTTQRNYRDGTFSGSSGDATDKVAGTIRMGKFVWAVWTGGDPGASATLTLSGEAMIP
jgi:hypothetical protein